MPERYTRRELGFWALRTTRSTVAFAVLQKLGQTPYNLLPPILDYLVKSIRGNPDSVEGQLQPSPLIRLGEEVSAGSRQDILSYYPELIRDGLLLKSVDEIETDSGIRTRVYNFTPFRTQGEAIQLTYEFLDRLGKAQKPSIYKYRLNRQVRLLMPILRPIGQRIMVLIPASAPKPSWNVKDKKTLNLPGFTRFFSDGNAMFSVVKIQDSGEKVPVPPQEAMTLRFAGEACLQTLQTLVLDLSAKMITDSQEERTAQEVVCRNIGNAMGARLMGIPYKDYAAIAGRTAIILSREEYDSMPTGGTIVK